jgi:hypothetical protein
MSLILGTSTIFDVPESRKDLSRFFQNRPGLEIPGGDFHFVLRTKTQVYAPARQWRYADMVTSARISDILNTLPPGFVFEDSNRALVHLATLVEAQWNGDYNGPLSRQGTTLVVMETEGTIVWASLSYDGHRRVWRCIAHKQQGIFVSLRWAAGTRILTAFDND